MTADNALKNFQVQNLSVLLIVPAPGVTRRYGCQTNYFRLMPLRPEDLVILLTSFQSLPALLNFLYILFFHENLFLPPVFSRYNYSLSPSYSYNHRHDFLSSPASWQSQMFPS